MATQYNIKVTSHWIAYTKDQMAERLRSALMAIERDKGNEVTVVVHDRK